MWVRVHYSSLTIPKLLTPVLQKFATALPPPTFYAQVSEIYIHKESQ